MAGASTDPETYLRIVVVLVPIYFVVIFGWVAGALRLRAAHGTASLVLTRACVCARPPGAG